MTRPPAIKPTSESDAGADSTGQAVPFGLYWPEKQAAVLASQSPPQPARLAPVREQSVSFSTARHRFYTGDNLQVLKLIEPELGGQVKLIYIDPPYNTGGRFAYRNDFAQPARGKADTNGARDDGSRLHGEWLSMMYPRLTLARRLLRADGCLLISIDDRELAHLTLMLDEIFGERNRVGTLVWAGGRKNDSKLISVSHDYIVCYAQDRRELDRLQVRWREPKSGIERIYAEYEQARKLHGTDHQAIGTQMRRWYGQLASEDPAKQHAHYYRSDERGLYFADNLSWPGGGGPTYPVLHPRTGLPCRVPRRGWVFSTPERMQEMIDDDRIHFGPDESTVPTRKRYLRETETQAPGSVFYQDRRAASQRLARLFSRPVFRHPKDEQVLARLVRTITTGDDLILDFFAGSGALGHGVLLANQADGGDRRFVLIQEACPTGDPEYPTIDRVTCERLRRVMADLPPDIASGFQAWCWQPHPEA